MHTEIPCAITVAMATPSTPMPMDVTEMISSTTFSREEKISKNKGVLESPMALNTDASTLYINRNGIPRK